MKEPSKNDIAKTVIDLINLQGYIIRGWNIPKSTAKLVNELIDDLKFQYQFQSN